MEAYLAMVTMVLDHAGLGHGSILDLLGNMAMPIYTYKQAHSRAGTQADLLGLALLSEIPHWVLFGKAFNVIFLFWLVRAVRDLHQVEEVCTLNFNIQFVALLLVGCGIFSVNPLLIVWVPLLISSKREWWYAIHGTLGLLSYEWLIHLVGYEMARNLPRRPGPPKIVWKGFYSAHMLVLGVCKRVYG